MSATTDIYAKATSLIENGQSRVVNGDREELAVSILAEVAALTERAEQLGGTQTDLTQVGSANALSAHQQAANLLQQAENLLRLLPLFSN